ncbi:phospholipase B1, membrane-associated-like [Patiria miniata]|uniref:Phospholipase B1, membrane-associated n=1 Tax=Patiria miniata TaxID=46514 RepID=A0A914BGR5_PATMI|nr:phospholipase B1, membrane-associated-like [Patiria miniata]
MISGSASVGSILVILIVAGAVHSGVLQDFEYDYDGVIADDYSDWNRTIRDLITLLPGYNCTGDPTWPHGEVQIFPCQILPPSPSVPNSVHKLRPSDINVIGALGDSLSAASGGGACSLPQMLLQYRGKTFSHGGDESFETVPTIANILRKYNPNLKGYGIATGAWASENAGMNVAVPGAVALDIPEQAENLVQKMKDDASIDYDKDWKLITIFIGGNDLCAVCKNPEKYSPSAYVSNIQAAIQVLHDQMPRTLVSVMGILDLRELNLLSGSVCAVSHSVFCPCISNATESELQNEWLPTLLQYQNLLEGVVTSGMYDDREDFTVVYQPFFHETKLPLIDGFGDISYFAPDCFHFGAKGHAETGNSLWNNMVQPVGSKTRKWTPNGPFTCPTDASPFIYTNVNSRQSVTTQRPPMTSKEGMEGATTATLDPGSGDKGDASGLIPSLLSVVLLVAGSVSTTLHLSL